MYRSFADVQTSEMVKLNVPEAERNVINLKPSDTVIELAERIAERADRIHNTRVDPSEDNMLKVTSDGKKLALDPRCFVPTSKDEEGSKLNEAAQRIFEVWEQTSDKKGTQIVFCDLSTPKKKYDDYIQGVDFDVYNELKHKLVHKGISRDEIAFIHEATTDDSKQALFDKVNSGAVRVLIGSTEKCGAGTNVQKRLVALHHLDTPYRPSDMEQREGRIIRQGNTNKTVDIYTYVTERTFDSYSYQILENKQRFISQINKGDLTVREAEDIDETTLSYAEIKAITAANPRIKRKMEVDTEIARLRVLEGQYKKNLYSLQDKIRKGFPEDIRKQELLIERVTLDLIRLAGSRPTNPDAFEISVNGKIYADKKEGSRALTDALYASKPDTVVAEYCGFKISICPISIIGNEREITLAANGQYTIKIGDSATGNIQRIENFLEDLPSRKERLEKRLQQLKDDLKIAEEQVLKPFEHEEQLSALLSEQAELNAELNLDKKDEIIIDDGKGDTDNFRDLPTPKEIREVKIIDEKESQESDYTDKPIEYWAARLQFAEAAHAVMRKDLDYVSGGFGENFLMENSAEIESLKAFLSDKTMPDLKAYKRYAPELLREFADRMWSDELLYYGWVKDDLPKDIAARIENIELKEYCRQIAVNGESIDYREAVTSSVFSEYDAFEKEMLNGTPEGVFTNHYKIHCYERLESVFENDTEYFSDDDYRALYEDRGHILENIFEGHIFPNLMESNNPYNLDSYDDTVRCIKEYCELNHKEIYEIKERNMQGTNEQENIEDSQNSDGIDYRQEVIESVSKEYTAFYDEVKEIEPNELFANGEKMMWYKNFAEVICESELVTDDVFKALYKDRGQILKNLYDDYREYNDKDLSSFGYIAKFIESYCERTSEWNIRTQPVYLQTWQYADEHGELDSYRYSRKLSGECKSEMDRAIRDNFDGMRLNEGFEDKLIERYGMERVAFIIATTINEHGDDGRYSRTNKEWAKTIPMSESEDDRRNCILNVHPAVLDGFTDRIRKKSNAAYEIHTVFLDM